MMPGIAGILAGIGDFAPPAPNSSVKWRLFFADGAVGSGFMYIAEVELRATSGGADQANGGTATASSTFSSFVASNAFDNNDGTTWISNGAAVGSWLAYEKGAAFSVSQIRVKNSPLANSPARIIVQYWDGSTWQNEWDTGNISSGWTSNDQSRIFTKP